MPSSTTSTPLAACSSCAAVWGNGRRCPWGVRSAFLQPTALSSRRQPSQVNAVTASGRLTRGRPALRRATGGSPTRWGCEERGEFGAAAPSVRNIPDREAGANRRHDPSPRPEDLSVDDIVGLALIGRVLEERCPRPSTRRSKPADALRAGNTGA